MLYVLIQLVAQGILGGELGKFSAAPLAEAASRFSGPIGRNLLVVGADTLSAVDHVTRTVTVLSTDPALDWPSLDGGTVVGQELLEGVEGARPHEAEVAASGLGARSS